MSSLSMPIFVRIEACPGTQERGRRTPFSSQIAFRTVRIYALIRKAVGIGKIGRGPGDQASDDIELGLLGEVVLGLMDRGIWAWSRIPTSLGATGSQREYGYKNSREYLMDGSPAIAYHFYMFLPSLQGMLGGSLWPCWIFLVTIGPLVQEILIHLVFQLENTMRIYAFSAKKSHWLLERSLWFLPGGRIFDELVTTFGGQLMQATAASEISSLEIVLKGNCPFCGQTVLQTSVQPKIDSVDYLTKFWPKVLPR